MKLLFAGTPDFSVPTLKILHESVHTVQAVLTRPDRPAGRGRKLKPGPVKQFALDSGLPVLQPVTLKEQAVQEQLALYAADALIVVAYGLILPESVLAIPRLGCLNVHASLLPRWRGAAPIQRAILAGDQQTGVTIMQMDKGLDTGDILSSQVCPISLQTRSVDLYNQLAQSGAELLLSTLSKLAQGMLSPVQQSETGICYADKITKSEALIDWQQSAQHIDRQIRAFNPWPVAQTVYDSTILKIWAGRVVDIDKALSDKAVVGQVLPGGKQEIVVQTGSGGLQITEMQLAGGKRMSAAAFLNAHSFRDKVLGQDAVGE